MALFTMRPLLWARDPHYEWSARRHGRASLKARHDNGRLADERLCGVAQSRLGESTRCARVGESISTTRTVAAGE